MIFPLLDPSTVSRASRVETVAARWQEALEAGIAPMVKLEACEQTALEIVDLQDLKDHQIKS
jgi:uncharacterized protein (DUF2237 family)